MRSNKKSESTTPPITIKIRNEFTYIFYDKRNISVKRKNLKRRTLEFCMHRDCFYSSFCRSVAVQYGWCQPRHPDADDVAGATWWPARHGRIRDGHKRQRLWLATVQRWLDGLRPYAPGKPSRLSFSNLKLDFLPCSQ